jgi:hypothetical protein
MVWCSAKAQGQLYLNLYFTLPLQRQDALTLSEQRSDDLKNRITTTATATAAAVATTTTTTTTVI